MPTGDPDRPLPFERRGNRGPGTISLTGAMTLEDMNLDRRTEFQGDTFDPFKIGQQTSNVESVLLVVEDVGREDERQLGDLPYRRA